MDKKDKVFVFISKNLYRLLCLFFTLLSGVFLSCLAITSWAEVNKTIFFIAVAGLSIAFLLNIKNWYDEHNKKYYDIPFHNLCIRLFDTYFKNWNDNPENAPNFRVSVMLAREERKSKRKYAQCYTRYQSGQQKESKVRFYEDEGEGAAGIVLASGVPSNITEPLPDFNIDPEGYIKETKRIYNFDREKTLALNVKARAYWCVPIREFDMEKDIIAIVSMDTMLPEAFTSESFKKIIAPKIIAEINSFSSGVVI